MAAPNYSEARPLNDYFLMGALKLDGVEVIEFAVPEPGYLVKVMSVMNDAAIGTDVDMACNIDGVNQTKGDHTMLTAGEGIGQVTETDLAEGTVEDPDLWIDSRLKFTTDGAGGAGDTGTLLVVIRRAGGSDA